VLAAGIEGLDDEHEATATRQGCLSGCTGSALLGPRCDSSSSNGGCSAEGSTATGSSNLPSARSGREPGQQSVVELVSADKGVRPAFDLAAGQLLLRAPGPYRLGQRLGKPGHSAEPVRRRRPSRAERLRRPPGGRRWVDRTRVLPGGTCDRCAVSARLGGASKSPVAFSAARVIA
jgi:hypothetical protein